MELNEDFRSLLDLCEECLSYCPIWAIEKHGLRKELEVIKQRHSLTDDVPDTTQPQRNQ